MPIYIQVLTVDKQRAVEALGNNASQAEVFRLESELDNSKYRVTTLEKQLADADKELDVRKFLVG